MDIDRAMLEFVELRYRNWVETIAGLNPQPIPPGDPRVMFPHRASMLEAELLGSRVVQEVIRIAWYAERFGLEARPFAEDDPDGGICPPEHDIEWILRHLHPHGWPPVIVLGGRDGTDGPPVMSPADSRAFLFSVRLGLLSAPARFGDTTLFRDLGKQVDEQLTRIGN